MKDDQWVKDHLQQGNVQIPSNGIFVVNEGNFMYGNATLSCYDTINHLVQNDLFYKINGLPLGDVAESMQIHHSKGYIVVNNSGKIYEIDAQTGKYTGKITGLTSPRYIHFINDQKAYVTDLYAGKIAIVNPATNQITGYIATSSHPSTEEMVAIGKYLYVTCWSGDNTVLVIDTDKDQIVAEIATGDQPCGIVLDKFNKIWVLCQSQPGNISSGNARLVRIDPASNVIDMNLPFPSGAKPVKLTIDGTGEYLFYLLSSGICRMAVTENHLPGQTFISMTAKLLYGLGIDPVNGNIYVSDALDYQQSGVISRFSGSGKLLDSFKAGIIPGRFCFR
jgi:YVTN family beta-propeller protein